MERDPNILAIAHAAIDQLGLSAAAIVRKRGDDHAHDGESEGAELWHRVADALEQQMPATRPFEGHLDAILPSA